MITIVGASGRQIAEIAEKAGYRCQVVDLFGDRDTRLICNRSQQSDSSFVFDLQQLSEESQSGQPITGFEDGTEFLITGGVERRSGLLDALSQTGALRSVSVESMSELGDPGKINQCFNQLKTETGISSFELFLSEDEFWSRHDETDDPFEEFIHKSLNGCGGQSVKLVDRSTLALRLPAGTVFQKRLSGTPISALYCSSFAESECNVSTLGVTQQLVGESFCIASPFQYCGSVSGYQLTPEHQSNVDAIGQSIASRFGLRGVFGVDFIHNANGVYPVDINPRFTASTEIIQRAEFGDRLNIVDLHLAAIAGTPSQIISLPENSNKAQIVFGKAVLFNGHDQAFVFPESVIDMFPMSFDVDAKATSIADVPVPQSLIAAGAPILSLMASGESASEVRDKLEHCAFEIYKLIAAN